MTALLLLVIAELVLVLFDVGPQSAFVLKPGIRWTLDANLQDTRMIVDGGDNAFYFSTDENGLRRTGARRPGARKRVMVLGDSVVFGWNLADADAMPARLQHHLDRLACQGCAWVINGGQPGYSALQSLYQLEMVGLAYKPDVVVVQWSHHNGMPTLETDFQQLHITRTTWTSSILLANTRLYRLIWHALLSGRSSGPVREKPGGVDVAVLRRGDAAMHPGGGFIGQVRVPPADFLAVRKRFQKLAEARGIALVWTVALDSRIFEPYSSLVGARGGADGVLFADQLAYAREHYPGARLSLENDPGHWSKKGSDVVGEALAAFLVEKGLLPRAGKKISTP